MKSSQRSERVCAEADKLLDFFLNDCQQIMAAAKATRRASIKQNS